MRSAQLHVCYLMVLPLLLQAPHLVSTQNTPPTGPVPYPVFLAPGYYEYFPVDSFVNGTVVQYSLTSNASLSTAFMTDAQFQDFTNNNGPVSDSVAHNNGTSVSQTLRIAVGSYDVLVYAYGGTANATLSISVFPNNPLTFGALGPPEPTGVASFGLTNESGVDMPYAIASTDVIGLASISSMEALNSSANSVGANPSGVTIQLNSVLVVEEGSNRSQAYWCQDTPDFVTAASVLSLSDNVWNSSVTGFLSNDTITSQGGVGSVSTYQQNGTTQYFYASQESNSSYSLPLGVALLMNATAEPGTGVLVQFGARTTGDVLGTPGTDWFDNVTIHDPGATNAYFLTDGNYSTPIGTFYDTEFVFAGEGNGESTSFTSLTASMGLYYANGTSSTMSVFPSYFGFGQDTAEAADNLRVSYVGNGTAKVSVGTPSYDYLGSASGSYPLAAVEDALGFPSNSPRSSTTTAVTTGSQGSTTAVQPMGIPEFSYQFAGVVLVIVIVLSYFIVRRRTVAAT